MYAIRTTAGALVLILLVLCAGGCSLFSASREGYPPILAQDELTRPYEKLGRIQVTREVYFNQGSSSASAMRSWGLDALRTEAARMNADAVILPEVTGHTSPSVLPSVMPTTEYRATGIAIRFK